MRPGRSVASPRARSATRTGEKAPGGWAAKGRDQGHLPVLLVASQRRGVCSSRLAFRSVFARSGTGSGEVDRADWLGFSRFAWYWSLGVAGRRDHLANWGQSLVMGRRRSRYVVPGPRAGSVLLGGGRPGARRAPRRGAAAGRQRIEASSRCVGARRAGGRGGGCGWAVRMAFGRER